METKKLEIGQKIEDIQNGDEGFIVKVHADGTVDIQENTYKGIVYRNVSPSRIKAK